MTLKLENTRTYFSNKQISQSIKCGPLCWHHCSAVQPLCSTATAQSRYCAVPLLCSLATAQYRYCAVPLLRSVATGQSRKSALPLELSNFPVQSRYWEVSLFRNGATAKSRYCAPTLIRSAVPLQRSLYFSLKLRRSNATGSPATAQ